MDSAEESISLSSVSYVQKEQALSKASIHSQSMRDKQELPQIDEQMERSISNEDKRRKSSFVNMQPKKNTF